MALTRHMHALAAFTPIYAYQLTGFDSPHASFGCIYVYVCIQRLGVTPIDLLALPVTRHWLHSQRSSYTHQSTGFDSPGRMHPLAAFTTSGKKSMSKTRRNTFARVEWQRSNSDTPRQAQSLIATCSALSLPFASSNTTPNTFTHVHPKLQFQLFPPTRPIVRW